VEMRGVEPLYHKGHPTVLRIIVQFFYVLEMRNWTKISKAIWSNSWLGFKQMD